MTKGEISCIIIQTTNNKQQTTNNKQQTTNNKQQTTNTSHRILWIDCAKVIGMYLVIMGHAKCAGEFGAYYGAFFMPMFFIISGFLERERLLKDTVIYGIKTLIIPFVLLYILYSIAFVISGIIIKPGYINEPFNIIKPFLGIFIGENGFTTKYGTFVCGPLWFVLALFWIKIVNILFKTICKNNIVYYSLLVFLMPFIIIILKYFEINLPLSLDSATLSFPFFAIGKISKRYPLIKERSKKKI